MHISTTNTTPEVPMTLAVRIDARRAQLLWNNASPVAGFPFDDRFEVLDTDGVTYVHDARGWDDGIIMWCDGALEAMTLADYEMSNGFTTRLLWDLCCGPDWPSGYAVLTSRPYRF
jgi:hypothetical protein